MTVLNSQKSPVSGPKQAAPINLCECAFQVSSPRRQVWPVGAKELGAAASGPKCGGVSRNDFDRRLGKMNQDQETDGLIETWKNAVRRTCLHYVAYADARDGMDGMKEARQFREFRVRLRTEQAVRHLRHHIYATAASFPPAIPEKR